MGRYLLTGSQNLALEKNLSQSLDGRVANLTLLPFGRQFHQRHSDPTGKETLRYIPI